MNIASMSDRAVIREIGRRVQRERLNRNVSQADLASKAGVSRGGIQNLEAGRSCTLTLLIRVLRALDRLESLDSFLPEPGISPVQLAKLKGRQRCRAGGRRMKNSSGG